MKLSGIFMEQKIWGLLLCSAVSCYAFIAKYLSAPGRPLVFMVSERSLMLFFTPILMAIVMFVSFTRKRVRILMTELLVTGMIVGVYAVINHLCTNSESSYKTYDYVLWLKTNLYKGRAKAIFICPNHTAAYFYVLICIFTALVFTRYKYCFAYSFPVLRCISYCS